MGDAVTIIGVAGRGAGAAEYERFVAETGVGGITHVIDDGVGIWANYGVSSQPAWAFVNQNGSHETQLGALGADGIRKAARDLAAA